MNCHALTASCGPEPCGFCGTVPCVGEICPSRWLCTSCGINPAMPPWSECAGCRAVTERLIRDDLADFGEDRDPTDDESWMEDYP